MNRLDGRVALVTGGANGIGEAVARRLSAEGAAVLVTDIEDGPGGAVAKQLAEHGGRASYLHLDVTSPAEWAAAVATAVAQYGGLDILVNNAGLGDLSAIEDVSLAEWQRTIDIDQTGVFLGMQAAADALAASGHGSVVNISSIFGTSGGFGTSPAYHAAKGAVRTLTKNVAVHWAERGIRVNSVHPGFIDTRLLAQVRGTPFEQQMLAETPMRRLGTPDEIAAGVAYLAGDDASFVTGLELYIDGGYAAR
ncbi:MAG TPA: glucose 1-dehydrogenase [Jatrophihabitans sp.]|nr:glucose 1-dehydrogenase [Jatrophihabitans sp.]